jgi:hypothetical protein
VSDEQLDRTRGVGVVVEVFGRPAGDECGDDLAGSLEQLIGGSGDCPIRSSSGSTSPIAEQLTRRA